MEDIKPLEEGKAFTNESETVINYKGNNYYKACDTKVTTLSHCIRRVDHPGFIHEDYDGNIKTD